MNLSGVKGQVWPNRELTDGRFDLIHVRYMYNHVHVHECITSLHKSDKATASTRISIIEIFLIAWENQVQKKLCTIFGNRTCI